MFLVHITSFNPCRQDTTPLAPSLIRQPICGPKPINSHYGKGPRLPTAAQHPTILQAGWGSHMSLLPQNQHGSGWVWLSSAQFQAGPKGCLQALCHSGTKKFSTTGAQAKPSPCKKPHAFGFAARGNMFSLYPGVKQPNLAKTIQSTAQSRTSQGRGVTMELRKPRLPSQTQNS